MVKLEEPDKGQAWVIAFAACFINMILSGLSRMVGFLYVAVLDAYGVSRQDATLPFTVRNSIRCLSGPLVGVIGQRYGIRAISFYGGVVATVGAALCAIAPDVKWLAVFWGGIHGFGFAFANTLFQVVVNQYFVKYRATASGIALCGACVGSFALPFIIEEIIGFFGLSGGFLILAGIIMHVLPPSLLLRSPLWVQEPEKYARLKAALKMKDKSVETLEIDINIPETPPEIGSTEDLRTFVRSTSFSNCPIEEVEVCSATRSLKGSTENLANLFENTNATRNRCKKNVVCTLYQINESPPNDRKNPSRKSSSTLSNKRNSSTIPTISGDLNNKEGQANSSDTENGKNAQVNTQQNVPMWESIKTIFILHKSPVFLLISLCMTTYVIIFIPILTVIVDYSKDKGLPGSAGKYLINAMALGDLIGRLGFGWVTDKGIVSISVFMTLAYIMQGLAIMMFPFALSLYSFMLLLIFYGITAGTALVHFPLLVLKYVDIRAQAVAMGCVGFMSGIVSFALPLLIGHFRDNVGSYDGMFFLTGGISILSGGLWLLEPLMARHQRKQRKKESLKDKMARQQGATGENTANSNGHKPS